MERKRAEGKVAKMGPITAGDTLFRGAAIGRSVDTSRAWKSKLLYDHDTHDRQWKLESNVCPPRKIVRETRAVHLLEGVEHCGNREFRFPGPISVVFLESLSATFRDDVTICDLPRRENLSLRR